MTGRRIAEARLRPKNQITLPDPIAEELGAELNDILVFEADPANPGTAVVRRVPPTFAGALTGVYGTAEEVEAFVEGEHAAWGE